MSDLAWEQGRLLQWLHKRQPVTWGADPNEYSPEAVRGTLPRVERLFGPGRYIDVDVRGWHHVPDSPVMVVSNHSGGTSIPDVWGFLAAWYRRFGVERPLHPMAHEFFFTTQRMGAWFAQRGALRGSREIALKALRSHRRDLMVMPGGDLDTWRPYRDRYTVRFCGRNGYARIALQAGVPIVPLAHAGPHETLIVLSDGRRLARALHLPELARACIWPIHLSLPWGLAFGPLPHLPPPSRFRYRIGAPIQPPETLRPGEEPSEQAIQALDRQVQAAVQALLDDLKATEA